MPTVNSRTQRGVTLIELIVFITVISLALGALLGVYRYSVINSVDPIVRVRLLEAAQSRLDEVLAERYDRDTPVGGVPACGSTAPPGNPEPPPCAGVGGVSRFDGENDSPYDGYSREVSVVSAGDELGLTNNGWAKRITVTATAPSGESLTLSAYRTNF